MKKTVLTRIIIIVLILALPVVAIGSSLWTKDASFREGWLSKCYIDTKYLVGSSEEACVCMYDKIQESKGSESFATYYKSFTDRNNVENTNACLKYH